MNAAGVVDDYLGMLLSDAVADTTPKARDLPPPGRAAPSAPEPAPPVPASVPLPIADVQTLAPTAIQAAPPRRLPPRARPVDAETPLTGLAPQRRSGERSARWLRLRCGDQVYGVELLKIREVVLPTPLLPVRGAAPALAGIMNLRGQVVPVIDLGLQLGEPAILDTPDTRVVVLEEGGDVLGLRVTAIEYVVMVADANVEGTHTSRLAPVGDHRIRGIARLDGTLMLLLDAARLLSASLYTPA